MKFTEKMLKRIKQFLNKPRRGRLHEFSSYLMYNPKPMQQVINIIRVVQPIFYGFFALVFFFLARIYVLFILFVILFLTTSYSLYKHLRYKGYKGNKITIKQVKSSLFKPKHIYSESKIVVKVNKKYTR